MSKRTQEHAADNIVLAAGSGSRKLAPSQGLPGLSYILCWRSHKSLTSAAKACQLSEVTCCSNTNTELRPARTSEHPGCQSQFLGKLHIFNAPEPLFENGSWLSAGLSACLLASDRCRSGLPGPLYAQQDDATSSPRMRKVEYTRVGGVDQNKEHRRVPAWVGWLDRTEGALPSILTGGQPVPLCGRLGRRAIRRQESTDLGTCLPGTDWVPTARA